MSPLPDSRHIGGRNECGQRGAARTWATASLSTPFSRALYLSDDATLDDGDVLLGAEQLSVLGSGKSKRDHFRGQLQSSASGKYLLAVLDATNAVSEVNEANNIVVFGPIA